MRFLDPQSLTTPEAIFDELEKVLSHMRELACGLTPEAVRRPGGLQPFVDQVTWLKGHYERLESLLLESRG